MVLVPDTGVKLPTPAGTDALQLKVTPAVTELKVTNWVFPPVQMDWFTIENWAVGAGFIVIVYVWGMPLQPEAVGVTW